MNGRTTRISVTDSVMKDDDNEAVLEAHQRLEAVHRKSFVADLLGAPPPQFIAMEATNQQLFDVT